MGAAVPQRARPRVRRKNRRLLRGVHRRRGAGPLADPRPAPGPGRPPPERRRLSVGADAGRRVDAEDHRVRLVRICPPTPRPPLPRHPYSPHNVLMSSVPVVHPCRPLAPLPNPPTCARTGLPRTSSRLPPGPVPTSSRFIPHSLVPAASYAPAPPIPSLLRPYALGPRQLEANRCQSNALPI